MPTTYCVLCSLVYLTTLIAGKPLEASTQPIYPYSLGYKAGEFQGDLYEGEPEGTIVAVKATLGDQKYYQINLGVELRPVPHHQKWVNPFYTAKTSEEDKNRTEIPTQLEFVIMGSSKFMINKYGDIIVRESTENYGLHSIIYFCVVLVHKEGGTIVSNPLSFIVEIIASPHPAGYNNNALTAGILLLLIISLGTVTVLAMSCRRWRFPEMTEERNISGSVKDDDVVDTDWKDHYHIKVEDLILEKDTDSKKCDSTSGSPRGKSSILRSDSSVSTLSWLRLHFEEGSDHVDSSSDKSLDDIRESDGEPVLPFVIIKDEESNFHNSNSLSDTDYPRQNSNCSANEIETDFTERPPNNYKSSDTDLEDQHVKPSDIIHITDATPQMMRRNSPDNGSFNQQKLTCSTTDQSMQSKESTNKSILKKCRKDSHKTRKHCHHHYHNHLLDI